MSITVQPGSERQTPASPPPRLHLLLVEDNRTDAELILATLKSAGYQLNTEVVDESSAFEDRLRKTDYDIIISDHNLQSWTGMDALEMLRASGKQTPFITLTATLGDEAAVEYIKRGATNYVLKSHLSRLPVVVGQALREMAHQKESTRLREQIFRAKREWELTFDAVPDPVLVIGNDCRIQRANYATTRIFSRSFGEIIGKPCYEVVHGRIDPLPSCPHQCLLSTGQNAQGDIEEPRLGRVFHSTTSPLRDPDGTLRGCVHVLRDVTERKQTEQALRRQALIFENMSDAVVIADGDFNIIDWNPAAERTFGLEKSEVIGRHVSILHPPEDAEEQLENIRSVMESGGTWSGEFEVNHRDGTPGVVEAVVVPLRDDRGVQIGFIGVNRDVTERKRAENDLRESEEKFRMLLHSTAEAIYGIDMEGNCTFCNPSTLRFLGYEHTEQLLGRNMHDLAHHTRPDGSVCPKSECEIFRALREGKGTHRDDEMLWRSDGTNFAAEYWSYPIEKNGERIGAVVTFLDISERRSAEKALHESEEKYRDLVENASYGIFRAKRDGSLLDVNPAFVAMLAYETKDDVLKLNLSRDVYENPEEREAILRRCESFGERVSSELNFRRKDGDFVTVKMNGRAVRDPSGDVAYFEVIAEDVTEQRKLEEQFRQAQKMEALGRLAGGIAHDFNNVLMVVSSYAEMILARGALDSTVERYTSNIMNAGRRAASLINQLLAFSRKQMLQPTTLDLAVVVAEMDQMLSRILGEDVETSLVIEPALGKVHADRTQIEQIVMNLVVNARDAMPGGGKLRIELQNVTVDTDYLIRHRNVKTGEYVMLAISDSGTGMDSVTKAKIFEPFFTTKEVGKGTGLGLATVYGIVKQSGGFIWVYSEPGFGSAFKVYLPRVNREATPIRESAEESKMLKGSGETVLLVDDDSDLRSAAREFLDAKGYRVLEAESGAAALHVCSSCERPIRVLVTDLIMPGMRGVELAAKIAELHPEVAIVYMSGYTDRFEDVADLGPGATFLQKPFSLSTLAIRLHTALQRRTPTESPQSETTNEQL